MIAVYSLAFCRWVVGIIFFWALVGKLQDIPAFADTIRRFKLLPGWLVRPAALICLGSEALVVLGMLVGGAFLLWGFSLATIMLTIFGVALASVLVRHIRTSCNCFGPSKKIVTSYEILRDALFILCALSGAYLSFAALSASTSAVWWVWVFAGAAAMVFVILVLQLKEILWVFRVLQ